MKKPADLDKMIDLHYKKKENKFDADSLLEEVGKILEKYMGYEAKRDYADFPVQEEPYGVAKDFPLLSAGDPRNERSDSDEYNPMDNTGLAGPASSGRNFMMPEDVVTTKQPARGSEAFRAGKEYEDKISLLFKSKGLTVEPTAGSAHKADVVVHFPAKKIEIEVKNIKSGKSTTGLDFGQFKLVFDLQNKKWFVGGMYIDSDDSIFASLFKKYLEDHLNSRVEQIAKMINVYGKLGDDKLLAGFKALKGDPVILGGFRDAIFGSEKELNISVDPKEVAGYYGKYDFIQVRSMGLYLLGNSSASQNLNIPRFSDYIGKSSLRFRIKYHGGKSDVKGYSFTVGIKLMLNKSGFSLENPTDLDNFISHFQKKI